MVARIAVVVFALLFAACDNSATTPSSPSATPVGNTVTESFAGTWSGTATDTSGSLAGSGVGGASAALTWQLSQTGSQVTGTIAQTGVTPPPGQPVVTLAGSVTGSQMAFTVTMPVGSMPAPHSGCSATATGTMTINGAGNATTGTYSGASSCGGVFSSGTISLARQ